MGWNNAKRRVNQCLRRIIGIAQNNIGQIRNIGEDNSKRNIVGVRDEGDPESDSKVDHVNYILNQIY
jgi:hypothetical protein